LCKNGEGALVWVYAHCDDVDFNNKIKGNKSLITEEEQRKLVAKL